MPVVDTIQSKSYMLIVSVKIKETGELKDNYYPE